MRCYTHTDIYTHIGAVHKLCHAEEWGGGYQQCNDVCIKAYISMG